jgi:hypothetical protein
MVAGRFTPPPGPKASGLLRKRSGLRNPSPWPRARVFLIRLGAEGRVSWEFYMEKFVERQNIARFTTLLMTETDTAKRELLQKLLTDKMDKTR